MLFFVFFLPNIELVFTGVLSRQWSEFSDIRITFWILTASFQILAAHSRLVSSTKLYDILFIQFAENIGWNQPIWYWLIPLCYFCQKNYSQISQYNCTLFSTNFTFTVFILHRECHESQIAYQQKKIWSRCLISVSNVGWCHLFILCVIIHWLIFFFLPLP